MGLKPYFEAPGVTLYCGDCLQVLPTLAAGSVDAVVTDPPYCSGGSMESQKNTGVQGLRTKTIKSGKAEWFGGDNMTTGGLQWLLRSVLVESRRLLAPHCSAVVFTDWRMVHHMVPALESAGMRYRNLLVWVKENAGLGMGFRPRHEMAMEFTNGVNPYFSKAGSNVLIGKRVRDKLHATQKPEEVVAEIISTSCKPGGLCLDPFAGSGTTGVACLQTGRNFIGVELSEAYCEIAAKRLEVAARDLAPQGA